MLKQVLRYVLGYLRRLDKILLALTLVCCGLGVVLIYSLAVNSQTQTITNATVDSGTVKTQIAAVCLGIAIALVAAAFAVIVAASVSAIVAAAVETSAFVDLTSLMPVSAVTVFSTFALSIGIAAISSALPIFTKIKKTPVDLLK